MGRGIFITFEGGEGSGKSTQIKKLSEFLHLLGVEHILTLEPGGTEMGKLLRSYVLGGNWGEKGLSPLAEMFIFYADRAQHVRDVIKPALEAGKLVISDRFADATLAYQGYGRGVDLATIARLNELATGGLEPDMTILLDIPAEIGIARIAIRNGDKGDMGVGEAITDRLEAEAIDFHRRVRSGYLEIANTAAQRFVVIDGVLEVQGIAEQIQKAVLNCLGR